MKNLHTTTRMREAIWASVEHCMSSDDNQQHDKCPQGPDSWCFFNKAIANGQPPPSHKLHVGTPLSLDVARAVRPIYDRMSDANLLGRIEHGRTQNANECLNGQIWASCLKTIHVGASCLKTVHVGASCLKTVHVGASCLKTVHVGARRVNAAVASAV